MMGELKLELASLPDREGVVAEIWSGDRQIAEIYQSDGTSLRVMLFEGGASFDYSEFLSLLEQARLRLQNSKEKTD